MIGLDRSQCEVVPSTGSDGRQTLARMNIDMRKPVTLTGKDDNGVEQTVVVSFDTFLASVIAAGYPVITLHAFLQMLPEGFEEFATAFTEHISATGDKKPQNGSIPSESGDLSDESTTNALSRKRRNLSPDGSIPKLARTPLQNLVDKQLSSNAASPADSPSSTRSLQPYQRQFMAHICDRCGKSYKSYAALAQHMRQKEYGPADLPYQCVECGKRFREARGIAVHCTKRNHKLPDGLTPRRLIPRNQT
uniref:C2H2-type domain-containing protein n=1 Tax=Panagrellus redivivus TaxID=6233 RepID=A0A7E4V5I2_PANRE